jgi:hypothetical protein
MIYAAERDLERVRARGGEYGAEIVLEILGQLKFLDEAGSNLVLEAPLRTSGTGRARG